MNTKVTNRPPGRTSRMGLPDRFWVKVAVPVTPAGCWVWIASTNSKGYGLYSVKGRGKLAHRVAYEALIGPIPAELQIDHLCRNRACVRPDHLEPVTSRENTRRGRSSLVTHLRFRNARKAASE